jgi:carboxyl-terminal processing protease
LRKNLIFHYATYFRAQRDSIPPAAAFSMDDSAWRDFLAFIRDEQIDYTTNSEELLEELANEVKDEQYYASLSADLESLRSRLKQEKADDISKFREEIEEELETEISMRYYHQRGAIEASFRFDPVILRALDLFDDPEEFAALLKP